ncbi:hypothetical protein [Klebsiella oxytoca]|uniref:hypothetical protein n=1 Tax=Klebsiella oxytoca TaxID=571 RepID=UPI000C7B0B4A|nr:hypothetical protein [Klebsiella oxytoca]
MTTDTTELAQREKFEAWAEHACAAPWGYLKKRRTTEGYSEQIYTCMWTAWKAAGAELVEALEKAQETIAFQQGEIKALLSSMESRTVTIEPFRSFVTDADLAALHRFAECCDDPESGGHDLEKEQVRRLETIGALQRSGRISYITGFGDVLISITAGIKWEAE